MSGWVLRRFEKGISSLSTLNWTLIIGFYVIIRATGLNAEGLFLICAQHLT